MKSSLYKVGVLCAVMTLIIGFSSTVHAQDANQSSQPPVPPPGIRAQVESRIQQNRGFRNDQIQGSSTEEDPGMGRPMMQPGFASSTAPRMMRMGSSTMPFFRGPRTPDGLRIASSTDLFKNDPKNPPKPAKELPLQNFEMRRQALIDQLKVALQNLDTINARIGANITKAQNSGITLDTVTSLYATAQTKLAAAHTAFTVFESSTGTSTVVSANLSADASASDDASSTTLPIDLSKPRQQGDAAIAAIKDARDAMSKVVDALIKAIGPGNASTTNSDNPSNNQ